MGTGKSLSIPLPASLWPLFPFTVPLFNNDLLLVDLLLTVGICPWHSHPTDLYAKLILTQFLPFFILLLWGLPLVSSFSATWRDILICWEHCCSLFSVRFPSIFDISCPSLIFNHSLSLLFVPLSLAPRCLIFSVSVLSQATSLLCCMLFHMFSTSISFSLTS